MGGQRIPGPIGSEMNTPRIDAGTLVPHGFHPPGPAGMQLDLQRSGPVVRAPRQSPPPSVHLGSGEALSLEALWQIVQSKRGFESSPSPFREDRGDELRAQPATLDWDAAGRGAKLGHPVETFAALQVLDRDGRSVAIGADHFDTGPLRSTEHDKGDKHAEARVLRALSQSIPGQVPGGSLSGVVDQNVCPACRAKLEAFARTRKLRLVSVQVPERARVSGTGAASPKTTSRTSLQALHHRSGRRVELGFRESYRLELPGPW